MIINNNVCTDGEYLYGTKLDGGDFGNGYIYKIKLTNRHTRYC